MNDKRRLQLEMQVCRKLVRLLIKDYGYNVSVWDGGTMVVRNSTSIKVVCDALRSTDMDMIYARKAGQYATQWARFIYGNDPWEVIQDYTVGMHDVDWRIIMDAMSRYTDDMEENHG